MRFTSAIGVLAYMPSTVVALIGIDTDMYNPTCAYACLQAISPNVLSCSIREHSEGAHAHGGSGATSPECRAGDTAYLTTLAWCMSTRCGPYGIPLWNLEKFWGEQSTGDPTVASKWAYSTALHNVIIPPTRELTSEDVLDFTALALESAWDIQFRTMSLVEREETLHARYGIALLVTGFATPIILTWLPHLPYTSRLLAYLNPRLIYPSAFGTYQVRPLPYLLGNAPTLGQALYIALLTILVTVLTAVNITSSPPSAWFSTPYQEILAFVMYRTGVLSFAILPLTILFASRNNVLLLLSNWSHATYLLLHRWVARLFALLALIHSIVALVLYRDSGMYAMEEKSEYWIWGAVATVAISVVLVASGLWVRRKWSYEVFLAAHVVLVVIVLVGCWYHVDLRFERRWGYEMWLYAACGVWFFDRLARVLRVVKTGVRRASVVEIGDEFVRVDVEGVRWGGGPGRHVYAYFPTLSLLKPWENHPFSLLPTAMFHSGAGAGDRDLKRPESGDVEKTPAAVVSAVNGSDQSGDPPAIGITLFIKKSAGLTQYLQASNSLLTLLDGPYPSHSTESLLRCDRLLLVGGGIGITGLLPWVNYHPNTKLCWSVKSSAESIARALGPVLSQVGDKDIRIGSRLDIAELLSHEVRAGWEKVGVIVCGPGGLCDDVRAAVAVAGRTGKVDFELEVDAYSW